MPTFTLQDLLALTPQIIVAVTAMVVLLLDAMWPRISKRLLANLSVLGLAIAGVAVWLRWPQAAVTPDVQQMIMADGYTAFFNTIFVIGGSLSIFLSVNYLEQERIHFGEYYALVLLTLVGAMVMAASVNLIGLFIGLEILSLSLYILAGFQTERRESDEAAMKYFLLGAFASAFFLYGIALVYGATGTVQVQAISTTLNEAAMAGTPPGENFLLLGGVAMLLVGFGFKVAAVPFHIWTPDVYQGAPTSVTAFMSVIAKAAGFAAFLRVLALGFQEHSVQVQISAVLASIAALTMFLGNVVAVVQPNLKRMLAYSSIAHAGYMLVGVMAAVRPGGFGGPGDPRAQAVSAVLFYMLVYAVSNLGAFGVILALRRRGEEVAEVADLAGVGYRYPMLGIMMSLFMLSLAGMPPTAGFFGKLFLVQALVSMQPALLWLIVLFVLSSVVSFFYYLGVVRSMYFDRTGADAGEGTDFIADWRLKVALGVSAIATLGLGLWAGGALGLAEGAAATFFGAPVFGMR
jgi:NADH-quinone oxidoreductase subunit N